MKFGLVDEKWIDNQTNKTNFYKISEALGETILQKASITPMIYDLKDENIIYPYLNYQILFF